MLTKIPAAAARTALRCVRAFASKAEVLSIANQEVNPQAVAQTTEWLFNSGLPTSYFAARSNAQVASEVQALTAAKKIAQTSSNTEDVWVDVQKQDGGKFASALYMVPAESDKQLAVESRIQKRIHSLKAGYRMEMMQTEKTIAGSKKLAIYTLQATKYANPTPKANETSIWQLASEEFLKIANKTQVERYQEVVAEATKKIEPVCKVFEPSQVSDGYTQVMFAFKQDSLLPIPFVQQLSQVLANNNVVAARKFVNTFANGVCVYALHVKDAEAAQIAKIQKDFFMIQHTPMSALTPKFLSGEFPVEKYAFGTAACKFVYYFLRKKTPEFVALTKTLASDAQSLARLRFLTQKKEEASHDRIYRAMLDHPALFDSIFQDFIANITTPHIGVRKPNAELLKRIKAEAVSELDAWILTQICTFNRHIVKTNFFKTDKAAISFRMDMTFCNELDLPVAPFGVLFMMGQEFQGFHVRFADVCRGGIRVVRSANQTAYNANIAGQFAENYGLAFTQNLKNKDIPEFGSKGTVLVDIGTKNIFLPFQKYIASMLDIIGEKPAEGVLDNYGKPDILFLGPDEWTAEFMEYAALYARTRNYTFWRAFTTGKPPSLGGVPHDTYGMTTRSVRRYWVLALKKLGLQEEKVTKFMTGGPDGDLGSNEILLSKDITIGLVDGSGVLCDPEGVNREELTRLAKERKMIEHFDASKLSPKGFKVLLNDKNVTLPHGEVVENGLAFRNTFHLHPLSKADVFVPCGGRPQAINQSNVHEIIGKDGKPKWRIISEGANLFITEDARLVIEKAGAVLYKDASANKGGVTSSSKEVLAALAFPDEEFAKHMAVTDEANKPQFYKDYVQEIIRIVEGNADKEFECIWKECERTGIPRTYMTNMVSNKINEINNFVQASPLFDNEKVRRAVLVEAIPKTLQAQLGMDAILNRVPQSYLKAIFGCHIACEYVYKYGINANEFCFFDLMQKYL